MARIRTIKPTMPQDRKLAGLSRDARLTFIYLISQADDQGLLAAEPRQLIGALFPHDRDVTERKLARWIKELFDASLVAWHSTHDGMRVLRLVGWSKHQQVKNPGKPFLMRLLADPPTEPGGDPEEGTRENENAPAGNPPPTLPRSSGESTEDVVRASVDSGGAEEGIGRREGGKRERGRGKGKKLAPDGASEPGEEKPPATSWPGRLSQVWTEAVGTVDPGRIGKELKPLFAEHGEELLASAIRHYGRSLLADGRLRFASPGDFARTAAQWIDDAQPAGEAGIGALQ